MREVVENHVKEIQSVNVYRKLFNFYTLDLVAEYLVEYKMGVVSAKC